MSVLGSCVSTLEVRGSLVSNSGLIGSLVSILGSCVSTLSVIGSLVSISEVICSLVSNLVIVDYEVSAWEAIGF